MDDLLQEKGELLGFQKKLISFEKLERQVGNIYHWALKDGEEGTLTYTGELRFEKEYDPRKNPTYVRIKEIYNVLKKFQDVEAFFEELAQFEIKSDLLKKILRIETVSFGYSAQRSELNAI